MKTKLSIQRIILFSTLLLIVINVILFLYNYYNPKVILSNENNSATPDKINYLVYYGSLNENVIQTAKKYDVVILHPSNADLTRTAVQKIQRGLDLKDPHDDVQVLAYISIGEDLRTASVTDDVLKTDPRFKGDGSGPRIDPRGIFPNGNRDFSNIDPLGNVSPGGSGYASYYLDDVTMDGRPDRNENFNGCFVNAGDPKWFEAVDQMKLDSIDKLAGLKEILTLEYGRGLGCDGVFLDTIDTCAPNQFTSPGDNNQTEYEWTAPGFTNFIKRLRNAYPDAKILQNRGLYYFNPNFPHYQYSTASYIDYLLFESYRLNSNTTEEFSSDYFPDNKYNYAPKIMAEAHRGKGFKVLSLGYAEGPPGQIDHKTLLGQSEIGLTSLLEDIKETVYLAGFNHYITDASITLTNTFVMDHLDIEDHTPPIWSSTYNDHDSYPAISPSPRVGIMEAAFDGNDLVVKWDVAMDMNGIDYHLYIQEKPFDFKNGPELTKASKYLLKTQMGEGYPLGTSPNTYAYQDRIKGLDPSKTYYLLIRGVDRSENQNEEKNTHVIKLQRRQ